MSPIPSSGTESAASADASNSNKKELKYGKDPKMRKLAQDIIKAQKGEIEQMNKWLDSQK